MPSTAEIAAHQREWFARLRERVSAGEPYVLAEALAPHEIFEAFDLPYVTNEWWSGIVASQRRSGFYFNALEKLGFHEKLERYSALSLGSALVPDDDPPWGGLPKPTLAVYTAVNPNHLTRWERTAEAFGIPGFGISVPQTGRPLPAHWWEVSQHGWEALCPAWQLDYVTSTYWRLIAWIEERIGRPFDRQRFCDVMERANLQQRIFKEIRDAMIAVPKSPVSLQEMLRNVMTIQWHRGSEWAIEAAEKLRRDVLQRIASAEWACPNERYRLAWVGGGLWQNTQFYRMFEQDYGATFVQSMYMSIAIDGYPRYGADPVRALASRYCAFGLGSPEWTVHDAKLHRVDGAVTVAGGASGLLRRYLQRADIPLLSIDVDLVDARTWDETAVKAQVEAFLCGPLARKASRDET
jgi:2-hydroxyglutaryl-CoA dehydratase, D-component